MKIPWPQIVLMVALPFTVWASAGWVMQQMSERQAILARYKEAPEKEKKPLNQRLFGYRGDQVTAQWGRLGELLPAQQRFLELDLIFPFLYGGAFAVSLLIGWALLGRPCQPIWALLPAFLMVAADWAENLIHLSQLERFAAAGDVSAGWISFSSVATVVKLWSIMAGLGWIVVMIGAILVGAWKASSAA